MPSWCAQGQLYLTFYLTIEIHPLYITMAELLMLFQDIIATYFQNQTEPVNALCDKKEEYSFVKVSVTYSNYRALKG